MPHLVLAGGGHANALALLQLGKRVAPITLISDAVHTPYSGMLPGYIAGLYEQEQCFINLEKLAAKTDADFLQTRVIGISGNELLLENKRRLHFDILSINTGASPVALGGEEDAQNSCAVKPIAPFINWLKRQDETPFAGLTVVGGGAGGIETVLALAHRWQNKNPRPALALATRRLLPEGTERMRNYVRRHLAANHIELIQSAATAYENDQLLLSNGEQWMTERVIYTTPVTSSPWFYNTELPLNDAGFFKINDCLQSPQRPDIFISGDAAGAAAPLPKSGVMAVRQGKILAQNLQTAMQRSPHETLKRFAANPNALYILGDGSGRDAVASRNRLTVSGRWVWHWKQYLDFKFMHKFT